MTALAPNLAVLGLGYVGLPLAVAFGRQTPTIGFDVQAARIDELKRGEDRNAEVSAEELRSPLLSFTTETKVLATADVFIVAVPTPVDKAKRPDLAFLRSASRTVGEALRQRAQARPQADPAVVIYESTVYPGCTEEVCEPIVAEVSGLVPRVGFKLGYSPERINPGDTEHTLERVVKIVAGQDAQTCEQIASIYERVVKAGVHRASSIKVAEAAKVIENTQRDLNIALMNELSTLFHKLGIPTEDVLAAAGTKWNFLPFKPGLVGGHCIPEDPYYLTHKAEEVGYHPHLVLAGRRINDHMGIYVAQETVRLLARSRRSLAGSRVVVLGLSFKENVKDVRNTRVVDVVRELESYGVRVDVHDPVVGQQAVGSLRLSWVASPFGTHAYDAVILAVPHRVFLDRSTKDYRTLFSDPDAAPVLVDVKGALKGRTDLEGIVRWSL